MQSACNQHAISMQSACNQQALPSDGRAISMQSACNQHAISMQSTGATFRRKSNQNAISMQSACNQHAINRRHLQTEELAEIGAHRVRDVDVRGWHGALLMQPMDKVRGACGDVRDSAL
jgi:hypothetical protein